MTGGRMDGWTMADRDLNYNPPQDVKLRVPLCSYILPLADEYSLSFSLLDPDVYSSAGFRRGQLSTYLSLETCIPYLRARPIGSEDSGRGVYDDARAHLGKRIQPKHTELHGR